MRGTFITFEGGEGSGKSTQIERIAARLRERGHEPVRTREPGGTAFAEVVRALLLDPAHQPSAESEALLMEAARADVVYRVIRPALEAGRVVLCDRYDDSTLAYQGGGRGLDREWLAGMNRFATGGLIPDLTLLFDVPPREGLSRRRGGGGANRLDLESAAFHERVRVAYLELARAEPGRIVVIDASRPPDAIFEDAWRAIEGRLARTAAAPPATA